MLGSRTPCALTKPHHNQLIEGGTVFNQQTKKSKLTKIKVSKQH